MFSGRQIIVLRALRESLEYLEGEAERAGLAEAQRAVGTAHAEVAYQLKADQLEEDQLDW